MYLISKWRAQNPPWDLSRLTFVPHHIRSTKFAYDYHDGLETRHRIVHSVPSSMVLDIHSHDIFHSPIVSRSPHNKRHILFVTSLSTLSMMQGAGSLGLSSSPINNNNYIPGNVFPPNPLTLLPKAVFSSWPKHQLPELNPRLWTNCPRRFGCTAAEKALGRRLMVTEGDGSESVILLAMGWLWILWATTAANILFPIQDAQI